MKSLLKFTLLAALIIGGKLTKQTASVAPAQTIETKTTPDTSMVFVNQNTVLEPIRINEETNAKKQGSIELLANMF
ncbi:hypothetical protein [Hymenobacter glacialis]|uniref:Uncharacterized protein n=1 Tax=Hymenobacter glacialis TaxID=1908236 RepID=A0A1G1T9L8_9BACT|nr:hypothetical protein [Hymenobacter glacialis]OGX87567.1 hypothetical protein BEN48_11320 [Hymenobacter glacialis]